MRKSITFILLCLMSLSVSAQALKGLVVGTDKEPLPFANVVLLKDSTFVSGVVTDDNGIFVFEQPYSSANKIKIAMVGYEDYLAPIAPTGDFGTITLKESSVMLDEVVVKANLPTTRLKGNAMVTSVENSVLSKLGTANDVLSHLPLVSESDGSFTVFGKGTPLIYINGKLVRSSTELQQLSSENIRSVEVVTNPGAQYSSEVQSVIRIKTIPPKGEGFGANLYDQISASHFARNTTDISLNYRHNGLEIFGNGYFYFGKRNNKNEAEMLTYGDNTLHQFINAESDVKANNLYGKLGFSYQFLENHSIGAYYRIGRERDDVHSYGISNVSLYTQSELTSTDEISYDWLNKGIVRPVQEANLYYNGSFGKLDVDFNADFTQSRGDRSDDQFETNANNPDDDRHIVSAGLKKSRLLAEKLILSYPVWKGSIEVGEEYTNSRLNYANTYEGVPIDNSLTDIHEDNIAAFASLSQTFGVVNVSAGLRYEHVNYKYFENNQLQKDQSKNYNNFFPTFSLSAPINKVNLSFSFTNKTRRPTYRQLDGGIEYINRFSYQCGNPKLQPTKIYLFQLMGMWKYFFAQVSVNHETDAIFWKTSAYKDDPAVKVMSFENVPHYTQLQVAIGAQPTIGCWKPQPVIGMMKQFYTTTYRGEKLSLGKPFFSFTLENLFSLPKNWTLGADFQFTTAGNGQNTFMKPTNKIDLLVRKSFLNNNLSLTLYATDLLNNYPDRTTMYSGDIMTYTYNQFESRSIRFAVRYKFNTTRSKYRGTGAGENEKSRM